MKRHHLQPRTSLAAVLAVLAATLLTPGPAHAHDGHVYKGAAVPLGRGTAHAWVMVGRNHEAKALGVSISAAAMDGIEASHGEALTLPLPPQAAGTPFNHVYLNWNPHGHPPAHIWGVAHFDVHLYMTTPAEREAITDKDPGFMHKAERNPATRFIPAGYVVEPHPVPAMGVHWADASTPEFHGKAFTHTLIYGAWDGRVTFIEPMIAKTVFDARNPVVAAIKQPDAVAVSGRYPTRYRIDFDAAAAEHRIVFEELVTRDATDVGERHAAR